MAEPGAPRFLLTFDFDETIVDENSDDSAVRAPRQASGCLRTCVPPSAKASTTNANTFDVESALRAAGHHSLFRRIFSNT
ncbi:hypothetical protein EI555_006076 [Monodon monoceros]|uniref:Uncharacterized protein n=1 Tax=Monodon monoceros TaxID=40151 RepID=A0A4U1ED50_MONMO|nr:hypothetical protein EI555_006076 [Monodon monoceros]